jgi:hypothetical protein
VLDVEGLVAKTSRSSILLPRLSLCIKQESEFQQTPTICYIAAVRRLCAFANSLSWLEKLLDRASLSAILSPLSPLHGLHGGVVL